MFWFGYSSFPSITVCFVLFFSSNLRKIHWVRVRQEWMFHIGGQPKYEALGHGLPWDGEPLGTKWYFQNPRAKSLTEGPCKESIQINARTMNIIKVQFRGNNSVCGSWMENIYPRVPFCCCKTNLGSEGYNMSPKDATCQEAIYE